MKIFLKILKLTAITILSLALLGAAAVGVAAYVLFTPERLTPIAVGQANALLDADVSIGGVDLTLFSTFPDFGIRLSDVRVAGRRDTAALLRVKTCLLAADVMAYLNDRDVVVKGVELSDVDVFAQVDEAGHASFDIVKPGSAAESPTTAPIPPTADTAAPSPLPLRSVQLRSLKVKNANLRYGDKRQRLSASLCGLNLNLDGGYDGSTGRGSVALDVAQLSLALRDTLLASNVEVHLSSTLAFNRSTGRLQLDRAALRLNDVALAVQGEVLTDTALSRFDMNLDLSLTIPSVENLLALIPLSLAPEAGKVKARGSLSLQAKATGTFKDSTQLPTLRGTVEAALSAVHHDAAPCDLEAFATRVAFQLDLRGPKPSFATIAALSLRVDGASLSATGRADNLLGDPLLNLRASLRAPQLDRLAKLAKLEGVAVAGALEADLRARARLSDATSGDLNRLDVQGSAHLKDVQCTIPKDSLSAALGELHVDFRASAADAAPQPLSVALRWEALRAQRGKGLRAGIRSGSAALTAAGVQDTTKLPDLRCDFRLHGSYLRMDSVRLRLAHATGDVALRPAADLPRNPDITLHLLTDSLRAAAFGSTLRLQRGDTQLAATLGADTSEGIRGWQASAEVDYDTALLFTPAFPEPVHVDKLQADVTQRRQALHQLAVRVGESDFRLAGSIENLLLYLEKKQPLKADLKLTAGNIDANQLLRIAEAGKVAAAPADVDIEAQEYAQQVQQSVVVDTTPPALRAVILPTDIFARFETDVQQATIGHADLQHIRGSVALADGALILQELGVVAHKKSRMKLTAIYRTPELNHIFASVEYHLMDVELGDLQQLVPEVDTLMPMLRSFEGKVDFHVAAQTYLDSTYRVKHSTLRAAASIHGERLVLLDNETFARIAKTLRFKNRERNLIDSLSVEAIVFRNQIELYPFLLSIDRYKVALGGRHKLDMTFSYHASILESPLPLRLGVDVSGSLGDMKIRPAKPRYAPLFLPERRNVTQSNEEEIRNQIRAALRKAAE
ncbi:MAG: AsmA family protein [Prevotellaceae bacterium]|jgi:hypothetical protein|nr:AsmA family protein [Prevotellaceae bacterium]